MKKLYIIGNGFDIHHNIPSRYSNYYEWLEDNNAELLERLRSYYNADEKEWWNQFEMELGHPDMADYIEETAFENQPDFASDEFRDRDYHAGQIEAENEIGGLMAEIKVTFTDWVKSLPAPNVDRAIAFDKEEAFFINFNYTDTLQTLYNVKPSDILFIHGNVETGSELVLGHNRTYDELDAEYAPEIPTPPDDLEDEDMTEWYDDHADAGEDYIHQSVREEVVSQVLSLRKNTDGIIKHNQQVFDGLKDVETVCIYGLSFSPVDMPYLDEIARRVDRKNVQWVVSYYSESDKECAEQYFKQAGVDGKMVNYVKLEDLLIVRQGELLFGE